MQASTDGYLEQVYLDHGPGLVRHLAGVTRDRELAEDLAHDAFVRLAREIESGWRPESPSAWLYRVGRNLATSRARHEQVVLRRESELPRPTQPANPETVTEERELGDAVGAVLGELSVPEQRALVMAAHGVRAVEIAPLIGRSPAATRTMLCRARAKIRARLGFAGFARA